MATTRASRTTPLRVSRRRGVAAGGAALVAWRGGGALPRRALAAEEVSLLDGPGGMRWADLKAAKPGSPSPMEADVVTVNYFGTLETVDGKKVDSAKFFRFGVGLSEVVKGWDLALLGDEESGLPPMAVGTTRRVVLPPELAYGARGVGCKADGTECVVPAGSTLVFDIELVAIKGL